MSTPKSPAKGADWTRLLSDPVLLSHLGKLLQICRDAPPEKREQALFEAIREIKEKQQEPAKAGGEAPTAEAAHAEVPIDESSNSTETETAPPFEPDIFTPSWGQDRRDYPRLKCFVAVELRPQGSEKPVWGNLSNTSLGGCLVESTAVLEPGAKIEIGLWVANGTLWVKGVVVNGVVTGGNPSSGLRVKFAAMETPEREVLREFLKFVENTNKNYREEHGYLAQLKG